LATPAAHGVLANRKRFPVRNQKSEIRNQKSRPFLLLLDPPAPGAWNMAVDETLLEAAANDGLCTLRFYRWIEPTLSLGYFQAYADREKHEASLGCAGGSSRERRRGDFARFLI